MPYHYDSRNYDPSATYKPELLPPGDYLCRIRNADYMTAQSGCEMIRVEFDVSGHQARVYYYLPLREATLEEHQQTDQRLGELFAACGIDPAKVEPMNLENWIGKTCGVHVKQTTYNGEKRNAFHYFIERSAARAMFAQKPAGKQQELFSQQQTQSQPRSYRNAAPRTNGPGGAPGFDRYGEAYPPAQNVSMDENDNFVPAEAEEADIPF